MGYRIISNKDHTIFSFSVGVLYHNCEVYRAIGRLSDGVIWDIE